MSSLKPNHREEGFDAEHRPSFSETVEELLAWKDRGFPEGDLGTEGESEVRSTFVSQRRFEGNPAQLDRISDFATGKIELDNTPPTKVLSDILGGEYDEKIKSLKVADPEKAYTFALYSLMQISGDSREKIAKALGQFLVHYDIPELHLYEHTGGVNRVGLEAAPFLMKLCRTAIEKFNLSRRSMRTSFIEAVQARRASGKEQNKYAFDNLHSVMSDDDHETQPSRASNKRLVGGKHPDDSNELSEVS